MNGSELQHALCDIEMYVADLRGIATAHLSGVELTGAEEQAVRTDLLNLESKINYIRLHLSVTESEQMALLQMPLTEAELAEAEARCNAASKGPWRLLEGEPHPDFGFPNHQYTYNLLREDFLDDTHVKGSNSLQAWRDALFTAHARTDVERLTKEVRRARSEAEMWRRAAKSQEVTKGNTFAATSSMKPVKSRSSN